MEKTWGRLTSEAFDKGLSEAEHGFNRAINAAIQFGFSR
jgi:hypothetical protein